VWASLIIVSESLGIIGKHKMKYGLFSLITGSWLKSTGIPYIRDNTSTVNGRLVWKRGTREEIKMSNSSLLIGGSIFALTRNKKQINQHAALTLILAASYKYFEYKKKGRSC